VAQGTEGHAAGSIPYLACRMPEGVHASPVPFAFLGYFTSEPAAQQALLTVPGVSYRTSDNEAVVTIAGHPIVLMGGADAPALELCLRLELPFVFKTQAPAKGQAQLLYPYSMRLEGKLIVCLNMPDPNNQKLWWVDGAIEPVIEQTIRDILGD
jgi:hypothetical protein